jgi:hypothetical protein
MNNQITNLSYSVFSNKGVFALLLGSGISASAGIPTGWDICMDLIKKIAILHKADINGDFKTWYKEKFKEDIDYSNLLEKLTTTSEERINVLKPYFEPDIEEIESTLKKPTAAHRKIADLVQAGFVKVIITTNFDRLIENALKDIGVEPVVISNPSHVENVVPLIHSNITLIKVNGDYLDTKFLNIKEELNGYDERIANLLLFIFENFGLITCGWSATWDIALRDLLKSANKFRYSSYFLHRGQANQELIDLCKFRRGQLVEIKDANELFIEVFENVTALSDQKIGNPLTTRLAVARVRKYLAKEEFLIPLSDIVRLVTEEVYKLLNSGPFPSPSENNVRDAFKALNARASQLWPIVLQGGYWSKEYHSKIWSNAIRRIGMPKDTGSSYAIWDELALWPVLVMRYVFGLACVSAENWRLLKSSFEITWPNRNNRKIETILEITHPWRVIRREHLNSILNQRYIMPASEELYTTTRNLFVDMIPDEKDFTNCFDYYEYICCLWYSKTNSDEFPPIGRFGVHSRAFINLKEQEFEANGVDFELIKNGLFTSEVLKTSIEKIKRILATERFY